MMYNTKLNEFTPEQLNALQFLVEEEIYDTNQKLQAVSKFDGDSELKTKLEATYNKQFETFILWKVQLENAKSDIKEMNKINAG